MKVMRIPGVLFLVYWILVPTTAVAQTALSGSISGVVRDTSGAVLPGVTVEASSPALIERTRTVTTDENGVYRIISLVPGNYSVTFSLAGFGTVKRDGVELTTGFTAQVNADLSVGALEETLTVSGAAPLVARSTARHQDDPQLRAPYRRGDDGGDESGRGWQSRRGEHLDWYSRWKRR